MVIHKETIRPGTQQFIWPVGSEILCIQTQKNIPVLWVLKPTEYDTCEVRHVVIYATGEEFEPKKNQKYIGTFLMNDGSLVFHVFEHD